MQNREQALAKWLEQTLKFTPTALHPLSGDASFRRYYRLQAGLVPQIIMDAPPDKESLASFLAITNLLHQHGLLTPKVYAVDEQQGFALLDDFGDTLLLHHVSKQNADSLYQAAITHLINLQKYALPGSYPFPCFNQAMMLTELQLFTEWFVKRYLNINLTASEEALIRQTFDWLINELVSQPMVLVHRDYHSRNIMIPDVSDHTRLALIDFQDAVQGPVTYDLVSLLKDCYIQWPQENVMDWLTFFYQHSPHTKHYSFPAFVRAFDLCGLQRHLKVLGIFCRLYLRDNKPNYLGDLPLTLHYVLACLETYDELQPFFHFFQQRIQLP